MDKSHTQAQETRKRNEQYRRERREREQAEIKAQANALRPRSIHLTAARVGSLAFLPHPPQK